DRSSIVIASAAKRSISPLGERLDGFVAYASRNDGACFAASFRMQSGHRQSLASVGIGRRKDSSAHPHSADKPQENSVPQAEQARRRGAGVSNRFVMNRADYSRGINPGFIRDGVIIRDKS